MTDRLERRDFFISFNQSDRAWATWIAWVLEEAGYSVWFQDWDFRGNFVEHMNKSHQQANRTLAVLSDHYFGSDFTLAEWSARFAQDPAARDDRLVPVKTATLSGESILGPIVYADLTCCQEDEAHRRLLGRVKKAIDAGYRDKPVIRPGFPGGPTREVTSKPLFPAARTERSTAPNEGTLLMPSDRSISIGGDAIGNVMTTGDNNLITAKVDSSPTETAFPPGVDININQELEYIRSILEKIGSDHIGKIGRALDDATEEARKPAPDKEEVGKALDRALDYAKIADGFVNAVTQLAPHMRTVVAWLGPNWRKLLSIVGLTVGRI
jgi:TIR domain